MLSPGLIDQSSLTGLEMSVARFPGDESPGYYHLVPPGRADRNVKLTLMPTRGAPTAPVCSHPEHSRWLGPCTYISVSPSWHDCPRERNSETISSCPSFLDDSPVAPTACPTMRYPPILSVTGTKL